MQKDLFGSDRAAEPKKAGRRGARGEVVTGKVRVHDPFELVRWLALSQPDPRKALAELVQNSLDAGAQRVRVVRAKERGRLLLRITDDGSGVLPDLDRAEALRYLATHVGHSRKRSLSPSERLELMTQGQYGIGLLGFWSLGESLEIHSAVAGQRPHRLVLYRDRPDYLIEPLRDAGLFEATATEVVVRDLHRDAAAAVRGRRAADFLAAELRGQLLARRCELWVEDRLARRRGERLFPVRPPRFKGERLALPSTVAIAGRPPVVVELYLAAKDEAEPIALYAGGTLVAPGFDQLGGIGLARPPWTDARLTGLIDYAGLTVAPGSRRGVVPDAHAAALVDALRHIESEVVAALEALERRRADELDRSVLRDLQRAFRGLGKRSDRFSLLPAAARGAALVSGEQEGAAMVGEVEEPGSENRPEVAADPIPPPLLDYEPPAPSLFPAGPLALLEVEPDPMRLAPGAARWIRARGLDATRRPVDSKLSFLWRVEDPLVSIETDPEREDQALVVAGGETGATALVVFATSGDHDAVARVDVEVKAPRVRVGEGGGEGIPTPDLVEDPGSSWRSRLVDERWQVNAAHPDYRAAAAGAGLLLRYLVKLFAKEVVVRSHADPRLAEPLEQLVELATFADRNLQRGPARRRRRDDTES